MKRRHRARHLRDGQSGVALFITISSLAMLIAVVSEFAYGTNIDMHQAANAKDELRAHYMARSAVSLSRLLIKIQSRFVEPMMGQAQKMLSQSGGGGLPVSLRVTDYAGPIMGFFGGSKEEVASLGGLIGLNISEAKGLGMTSGRMDAEITTEDGKIDLNCAGGSSPGRDHQLRIFRMLSGLVFSPRYNRLFQEANADGQFIDRIELGRALIDWADVDEQGFSVDANGSSSEDYKYDARHNGYRAHNNFYDSVEEVGLVRGMSANAMDAFLSYLTVYASDANCRVNLSSVKGDCTPLLVGLIRAATMPVDATKPPADPTVMDDTRIYPLASILCERGTAVGFDSLATIAEVLSNPAASIARDDPRYQLMQSMRGVTVTTAQLSRVAFVGPPRVYRIVATGESGKVKKKITAVLDTKRTVDNPISINPQSEKAAGVLQYWREE